MPIPAERSQFQPGFNIKQQLSSVSTGQHRQQGKGQRKIQRYLAPDCPVFFTVGFSKGSLRVTKSTMCHRNHALDAENNQLFSHYISNVDVQRSTSSSSSLGQRVLDQEYLKRLVTYLLHWL